MAGNAANVIIPAGVICYMAAVGTTAPTDLTTAWGALWLAGDPGILAEDASDLNFDSDANDYYGRYATGTLLVRHTNDKQRVNFNVGFLEDNATSWALANPGSSKATAAGVTTRTYKAATAQTLAIGFETIDGTLNKRRWVIPSADVSKATQPKFYGADPGIIEVTVTPYYAADGTWAKEITNNANA